MIEYRISKNNRIEKIGDFDQKIFSEEFSETILPSFTSDYPSFMSMLTLIHETHLKEDPDVKACGDFGAWIVFKIGEKGVEKSLVWATAFERDYEKNHTKTKLGANALVDFLAKNWTNPEKQFVETNRMRRIVEETLKKIYKKAKKIKKDHKGD